MGLEQTKGQVWSLFIAITLRQVIVTFSVCLELQHSGVKTFLFLAYLTVLSLLTSLGTALGIVLTEAGSGLQQVPVAAVHGLAGGALLYSVLCRVSSRQRIKSGPALVQVGGLILGFLVILVTEIFGHPGDQQEQEVLGEEEDVFYRPIPPLPPLPPLPSPASIANTTVMSVLGIIQEPEQLSTTL